MIKTTVGDLLGKIIRDLLGHLPDSMHDDPSWDWAWNELSDEAQASVKAVRIRVTEFLAENEKGAHRK